jgi:serine/threonine protein kinase
MGVVFKARQRELDRPVALKILTVDARKDPTFAERFAREARALATLSHPNVVAIHDSGRAGEHYYLLMEYVDGLDLRRLLEGGELAPKQALDLVSQISGALQYAHDEGVVHRDIKPENILVDRRGRAKIADFGLAKLLSRDAAPDPLTGTHQAMGTWHYMAPEQIERPLEVDHRADIYSLGVVFYELLTGELPLGRFTAPSDKIQVDVRVDEVVLRTLEKEPARRYQHASEVKTRVDAISGDAAPAPQAKDTGAVPSPSPKARSKDGAGATVAGLVATTLAVSGLGAVGLLVMQRSHQLSEFWPEVAPLSRPLLLAAGFMALLFVAGVLVLARHARAAWPWMISGALLLSTLAALAFFGLFVARPAFPSVVPPPVRSSGLTSTGAFDGAPSLLPFAVVGGGLLLLTALALGLIFTLRRNRTP